MTEPLTPKPRRRWFALSLRGAMIAVLIVGGLLGWKVHRARVQRRAIAAITRVAGEISFDWQKSNTTPGGRNNRTGPPWPAWLRRVVGDEYFQEVEGVAFYPPIGDLDRALRPDIKNFDVNVPPIFPEKLACLDGLDRLDFLYINGRTLAPEDWARLTRLTSLRKLYLIDFAPAYLPEIGKLGHIESLAVSTHQWGSDDLAFLDRLPRLRHLLLMGSPIPTSALARIGRSTRLESLSFDVQDLTDADFAHLMGLNQLEELHIDGTSRITDAGLSRLAGLRSLTHLHLGGTPVTEPGLAALAKLPKLTHLVISMDQIRQPVVDALMASRPDLKVQAWSPPPPPPLVPPEALMPPPPPPGP